MRGHILAGAVTMLAACAEPTNFEAAELKDDSQWRMKVYLTCMENAAIKFSEADVSPTEASIAAQGHCALEFSQYETAAREFMMASVEGSAWKAAASERAGVVTNEIKVKAQESAVARVVEARMIKSAAEK